MAAEPPRYVPTLTEVVRPGQRPPPVAVPVLEEEIVHRIMQRIDLTLDRRLREAIGAIVTDQTRSLGPILREEIELVVQRTVSEALVEEISKVSALTAPTGPPPPGT